jgi:hypothetical protein
LLAPWSVVFLNRHREELRTKMSLKKVISEVTGIQVEVLLGADLEQFSVAQRMSRAFRRKTTRLEDQTYCLIYRCQYSNAVRRRTSGIYKASGRDHKELR